MENSDEDLRIYVTVEKAEITRILESKQDPYVTLKLGNQTFSTKPQMDIATNPFFNETFAFLLTEDSELNVELYDYDDPQKSDLIGKGVCSVKGLKKGVDKPIEVTVSHRHKSAGKIYLKLKLDKKPEEPKKAEPIKEEPKKVEIPKPKHKTPALKRLHLVDRKFLERLDFVNYFYKDETLIKVLTQGLLEVNRNRPKNAVIFLGEYLLKYSNENK